MNNSFLPQSPNKKTRIGFHYFPDTLHYRESDLETWLPELNKLNASWLVLHSETERAIPEHFIHGLVNAGIEPLIKMDLSLAAPPETAGLQTILETYARWGVHIVQFFDRPNDRSAWQSSHWVKQDLVEGFTGQFMPFAELALDIGLIPVLPPLVPGGSYWDTAFLRSTLESFARQANNKLMDVMVLSAYAWTDGHDLNWGAGGPQKWKNTKPYFTPPNEQNHKGFRIYEWYQAAAETVLQKKSPLILLNAGCAADPLTNQNTENWTESQIQSTTDIYRLLRGEKVPSPDNAQMFLEPIPSEVISCNFWLLAANPGSRYETHAWFNNQNQPNQIAEKIGSLPPINNQTQKKANQNTPINTELHKAAGLAAQKIQHYLLLPAYEWGIADWHLEVIQPFVKKHQPTIGFSADEAALANHVTIVGNSETFPDSFVKKLCSAGCTVERISGDGTSIATQLAER